MGQHSFLRLYLLIFIRIGMNFSNVYGSSSAGGTTRFYDFKVQIKTVTKLCNPLNIVTVNGMYPGPTLYAQEDDTVTVEVTNETPYNITIHWHGVRQRLTCWYDGPAYITQCPIQPGNKFTYKFMLQQQKGTLFWHAHVSWLRTTLYGPIVIYPKTNVPYPFQLPYEEYVIVLGEFWLTEAEKLERMVLHSGGGPPIPDAYVINGHPGPLYDCCEHDMHTIKVIPGKTYLMRIISAALNTEHFFSIANHNMTVVEVDGLYTKPFVTDNLLMTPGQTTNVLLTADQPIGNYYMGMGPYVSAGIPFQKTPALSLLQYHGSSNTLITLPHKLKLPIFNDSNPVQSFMDGLKSLANEENPIDVPQTIDRNLFFTIGLNIERCNSSHPQKNCQGVKGGVFAASINNITFVRPKVSILQAYYYGLEEYFTQDFPDTPERIFDFVNDAPNNFPNNTQSLRDTRVTVLEYGSNVQLILQDTGTVGTENHPIHLHGFNFYVVGSGLGNYDPTTAKFNLVDPPSRNTIGVPAGGWAAIRFTADNPGVWFMHCHLEIHTTWGLSMAFLVKNGEGSLQTLPPPPSDTPAC